MTTFTIANQTLTAIDRAMTADQGAKFRELSGRILPHMGDAYRGAEAIPFRSHLGASLVGGKCARKIWYGFRWVKRGQFGAQLLRLFNRGHLEEARIIAALLCIPGVQVFQQDTNGKQFRISDAGGHFGGSGDGVVVGLPELMAGVAACLECKTHNAKSFAKLKSSGVKVAKFEHYVQMCVYMRKMGLGVALYVAVNKDNDEYHMELVPLDVDTADQFINRGVELVFYKQPPEKLSTSPGWFECKWCDYKDICHKGAAVERNCRTCQFAFADSDGEWRCSNTVVGINDDGEFKALDQPAQFAACDKYKAMQT